MPNSFSHSARDLSSYPHFKTDFHTDCLPLGSADSDLLEGAVGSLPVVCLDPRVYTTVTDLIEQRRYSAALLILAQLPAREQVGYQFWYLQGSVLANLGRYPEALQFFTLALQADPHSSEVLVFQSVCWIHLQQYEAALACCDRTLALYPHDSQAWLFRGVALQRLGHYKEAYKSYENALNQHHMSLGMRCKTWLSHKLNLMRASFRPAKTLA
jgi:tetratricopeptide (TPR) repeat protein